MRRGDKITVATDAEVDYIRRHASKLNDVELASRLCRIFGNPLWNRKRVAYVRRKYGIPSAGHTRPSAKVGAVRNHKYKGKPRLVIKVGDRPKRWILYARYVWEQAHGSVPKGCVVMHIDGDRMNCELSNLRCVTKQEHGPIAGKRSPFDEAHRAAIGAAMVKHRAYLRRKKAAEIYLAHKPYEFAR